ncbi:MAG: hypothetical protein HY046_05470 [Acidobacteria bacterium]|nr:hypothetical protein [Acidobacteriota bacterium]
MAAEGAKLTFRKIFKSSNPEFIEITISESGAATYDIRQLDEDAAPQKFEIGRPVIDKLFSLTAELGHFRNARLDVRKRIANLGEKTLVYEKGAERNETVFNYTTNSVANNLMTVFEGLARQQTHLQNLKHLMRFDRLGVYDALKNFETDLNHGIIPEPERLTETLEGIANDTRIVDIARQRARALAERCRAAK